MNATRSQARATSARQAPAVDALLSRFQALDEGQPKWAWPYVPSIPLVGERYKPGKGLLIYASAENLTWMNTHEPPPPARFSIPDAWNRYRVNYEEAGRTSDDFFPVVGIQPVTDGGLLAAGLFVAVQLGLPKADAPRPFLERIAVTNWAKFSIKKDRNYDYVGDLPKLTDSLAHVVTELAVLQPAAALVPQAIWRHRVLRQAMRGASPATVFVHVPQCNSTVVNCHLKKLDGAARRLARELADTALGEWMGRIRRMKVENAWRYMAYIKDTLARQESA